MAGNQPARSGMRLETIDEFMARRRREVENFGREAEEAAYAAVGRAIRAGQNLRLSRPSEVMAYGANLVGAKRPQSTGKPRSVPARPTGLDNSPTAKAVVGTLAHGAGLLPGAVRGAAHTVADAAEGAKFVARLTNPVLDLATSAPGEYAPVQVFNAGAAVADYVRRGVENPAMVRRDIASAAHDFRVKQDPTATPVADTLGGEARRKFNIGMNNGELVFDVGSLFIGGEAIKGAAGLGRMAKPADAAERAYLAANPGTAASFARPYPKTGMSHHIVNRAAKLPSFLGGGRYPEWFIESEFNKIRHDGLSYRDLYRNHRGVGGDKHFSGGAIGREFGGGRWRAEDLGWDTYGPLDRLNYGTSPATKAVVSPILLGGGAGDLLRDEAP